MDRRKRTARTVALMSLFSMTDTQENVPVASFVGDGSDLISLIVGIEPVQAGSGDPSPDNVRPISGWTGAKVTRTGINVWDEEWEEGSIDGSTGQNESASGFWRTKNYIPIEPDATYYVACSITGALRGRFYDSDKNYLGTTDKEGQDLATNRTFTAPSNAYFVRFAPNGNTITTKEVSVNYPSTDTDYHSGADNTTYTITFPTSAGTVYGGTLDVTQGKLTVTHGIVDMGTLQWNRDSGGTFYVSWPAKKGGLCDIVCSSLAFWAQTYSFSNYASYPDNIIAANIGSGNKYFYVKCTSYTTAADFKTAMTGQTIAFELEEPIVYDLTPTQVTTLLGTNNIWADTGDIKYIEYNI